MCLPKHTKIQPGQGEGKDCKEGVDPTHVQTENCAALEKVSSSWFSCRRSVCPICIVGISCFICSVKYIYIMKLMLWCLTFCCYLMYDMYFCMHSFAGTVYRVRSFYYGYLCIQLWLMFWVHEQWTHNFLFERVEAIITLHYRYRLGDAETPEGTSEEESENEDHTPAKKQPVKNTTSKG